MRLYDLSEDHSGVVVYLHEFAVPDHICGHMPGTTINIIPVMGYA
jgi:hypothetical protein